MPSKRVLLISFDPLTTRMPGPAIRAWNLAIQLASEHTVTLVGTAGADRKHPAFDVRPASGQEVDRLVEEADVVVAPTSVVRRHPAVAQSGPPLCIDMYDPTHLENLEPVGSVGGRTHAEEIAHQVSVINDDLQHGDFFLCASERQRDFWLGSLAALGRINPDTYSADPTLAHLLAIVPFGVDPAPPTSDSGILRRLFPAIEPSDPVLVWGGGVYNWFDPLSLLYAVERLRRDRSNLRLVFLGMQHPNSAIPEMRVAEQLRRESDRLGLTGEHVFFNAGWVPYDDRGAYLVDADVGISTHFDNIETRFSSRTRILDYLWAGLPTVLTSGDTLSEAIALAGIGMAVPPGDPGAIATAVDRLLEAPPPRESVTEFSRRYHWDKNVQPLLHYCRDPWKAPDDPRRLPMDGLPNDDSESNRWVRRLTSRLGRV